MPKRKSLAESLVEKGIVNAANIKKAEEESLKAGEPLRKTLIKMGLISEDDIIAFFEQEMNIPHIELSNYLIDEKIISLIPEELARRYHLVPLYKAGNILTVAMADPLDIMILDELRTKTGCTIEPTIAKESEIKAALNQYYGTGTSIEEIVKSIDIETIQVEEKEEEELSPEKLRFAAEEAPIIKLVNLIIIQAIRDGASDIHMEPEENLLRIRYRIDGVLHETPALPKNLQAAIISRIKIMADLNIAVKRAPQDGRIQIKTEGKKIDLRVSSFPTIHGENVVMRILDPSTILISLDKLGFSKENLEQFKALILKPHGIILVTGPTGSGKTTTLYSALSTINSPDKNIITLEDPVEYQLELIRQSQVNPKAGLTFATGLRSILRQDPDIILVGEIRDFETAEIAIHSALTGHLVFSTLHTNDAAGALTRLIDMGIEPFLISSSVIAILAQRLVRTICPKCKEITKIEEKFKKEMKPELAEEKITFYKGKGCQNCMNTGYKGRIGIYELLTMTDKIRELINAKASAGEIKKVAEEEGMRTLRQDGIQKVKEGLTTLEEVIRVTQID